MIRRRCTWHVRQLGGLIRCQLPRKHAGDHTAWLGISPITWANDGRREQRFGR